MKKVLLLAVSFLLTPLLLFISIIYFSFLSFEKNGTLSQNPPSTVAYAALPYAQNTFSDNIEQKDVRVDAVSDFFKRYRSELEPYAENIIASADKYGLDYRLVPAIAMQESNLCKKAPKNSYNCWGFGIYGKQTLKFDNFEEAIEIVTKTLVRDYKNRGLVTPEEIMKKYTPSSNGSWARGVSHFMNQLQITL